MPRAVAGPAAGPGFLSARGLPPAQEQGPCTDLKWFGWIGDSVRPSAKKLKRLGSLPGEETVHLAYVTLMNYEQLQQPGPSLQPGDAPLAEDHGRERAWTGTETQSPVPALAGFSWGSASPATKSQPSPPAREPGWGLQGGERAARSRVTPPDTWPHCVVPAQ